MQSKTITRILTLTICTAAIPSYNVSAVPPGTASDHSATAASGSIGATVGLAISIGLPKENKSGPGNPGGPGGNPGNPGGPGGNPGNPGGGAGNPGGPGGNPGNPGGGNSGGGNPGR